MHPPAAVMHMEWREYKIKDQIRFASSRKFIPRRDAMFYPRLLLLTRKRKLTSTTRYLIIQQQPFNPIFDKDARSHYPQ